jgi:hypothetical protein
MAVLLHSEGGGTIILSKIKNYIIFSNLILPLFTVLEGQKVGCILDLWSRAGFWKNDTAPVHAVRTIQYNTIIYYFIYYCRGTGW